MPGGRSFWGWLSQVLPQLCHTRLRNLGGSPSAYLAAKSDTTGGTSVPSIDHMGREESWGSIVREEVGISGAGGSSQTAGIGRYCLSALSPEQRALSNPHLSGTPPTVGKSFKLPALHLSQGSGRACLFSTSSGSLSCLECSTCLYCLAPLITRAPCNVGSCSRRSGVQ